MLTVQYITCFVALCVVVKALEWAEKLKRELRANIEEMNRHHDNGC